MNLLLHNGMARDMDSVNYIHKPVSAWLHGRRFGLCFWHLWTSIFAWMHGADIYKRVDIMLWNGPAPRYIYDGNALRYTYMLGMLYCIYKYIWGKAQRYIFMLCIYIYIYGNNSALYLYFEWTVNINTYGERLSVIFLGSAYIYMGMRSVTLFVVECLCAALGVHTSAFTQWMNDPVLICIVVAVCCI